MVVRIWGGFHTPPRPGASASPLWVQALGRAGSRSGSPPTPKVQAEVNHHSATVNTQTRVWGDADGGGGRRPRLGRQALALRRRKAKNTGAGGRGAF